MCYPGCGFGHASIGKWTGPGVEGGALDPSAIPKPPSVSSIDLVIPVECCRIETKVDGGMPCWILVLQSRLFIDKKGPLDSSI